MNPIRISAVSYLNTIPFLYGLEKHFDRAFDIEISKEIPSVCAQKLMDNKVDLGLVPVAILPKLHQPQIVSDYCIGANGKVTSVLLLSDVPLNEIKRIYLDYHSRTSVQLCRILCERYWKISPDFIAAVEGYEKKIEGKSAAVVIGDRAFAFKDQYNCIYDLSEAWYDWKGLPFVFAAWVSNKALPEAFIAAFNASLKFGIEHIKEAIKHFNRTALETTLQFNYLNSFIHYDLDYHKKEGLNAFLSEINEGTDIQ